MSNIKQRIKFIFLYIRDIIRQDIKTIDISTKKDIRKPLVYEADLKSTCDYIVSAVVLDNGNIIAARSGGRVVRITNNVETEVLYIEGAIDWRGLWKDSKGNVFISPHASPSFGTIDIKSRGIYKLKPTEKRFRKTLSLYNPSSNILTEKDVNDDTIWTFCEDGKGNIYAGVYAHTIRYNPTIYKSYDGGETWEYLYNFNLSGVAQNGKHIHGIVYSKTQDALYTLVGEINELYESKDGGKSWNPLGVKTELAKGCSLHAVNDGIIIGSDSAYDCIMSKYYFESGKVKTTSRIFGSTIFAIRESDLSHNIYAFSKIDSSVNVLDYYPEIEAIENNDILKLWLRSNAKHKYQWKLYNHRMKIQYPDDAIRPQHIAILMSEDDGETWRIIHKAKTTSSGPNGYWTTGHFYKGECLSGFVGKSLMFEKPIVISETGVRYI